VGVIGEMDGRERAECELPEHYVTAASSTAVGAVAGMITGGTVE